MLIQKILCVAVLSVATLASAEEFTGKLTIKMNLDVVKGAKNPPVVFTVFRSKLGTRSEMAMPTFDEKPKNMAIPQTVVNIHSEVKGEYYMLNDAAKTYNTVPMGMPKTPSAPGLYDAAIKELVIVTGKKQKIAKEPCTQVTVKNKKDSIRLCVSSKYESGSWVFAVAPFMLAGTQPEALLLALKNRKLGGLPLSWAGKDPQGKPTSGVIETLEPGTPDEKLFEPPSDFKKEESPDMGMFSGVELSPAALDEIENLIVDVSAYSMQKEGTSLDATKKSLKDSLAKQDISTRKKQALLIRMWISQGAIPQQWSEGMKKMPEDLRKSTEEKMKKIASALLETSPKK